MFETYKTNNVKILMSKKVFNLLVTVFFTPTKEISLKKHITEYVLHLSIHSLPQYVLFQPVISVPGIDLTPTGELSTISPVVTPSPSPSFISHSVHSSL